MSPLSCAGGGGGGGGSEGGLYGLMHRHNNSTTPKVVVHPPINDSPRMDTRNRGTYTTVRILHTGALLEQMTALCPGDSNYYSVAAPGWEKNNNLFGVPALDLPIPRDNHRYPTANALHTLQRRTHFRLQYLLLASRIRTNHVHTTYYTPVRSHTNTNAALVGPC